MAYKFGFIVEQTLGHKTHTKNLQANINIDPDIEVFWSLPSWEMEGIAKHLPLYKSNWTVRAGLQARRSLASMRRQAKIDGFFFHTQVTASLAIDQMRRVPSIVSLDATPLQYDELGEFYAHKPNPDWFEKWKWRLNRSCFQTAKGLVTWSHWAKGSLVDDYQIDSGKITVIPPGVNVVEWARPDIPNGDNRTVRILFVGSDLRRKGGYDLLEAFRQLRMEVSTVEGIRPDIQLHLVTKDLLPEEPGLFVYNHMEPNSSALKQLYYDSQIFCLPTYGDCLPMVLSEAGAAGLPLVSTDVAAIPEIVRDKDTGFLVPVGDASALHKALQELILNPSLRYRLGDNARRLIEESHDAPKNALRLLDLLKRTTGEAHS